MKLENFFGLGPNQSFPIKVTSQLIIEESILKGCLIQSVGWLGVGIVELGQVELNSTHYLAQKVHRPQD